MILQHPSPPTTSFSILVQLWKKGLNKALNTHIMKYIYTEYTELQSA